MQVCRRNSTRASRRRGEKQQGQVLEHGFCIPLMYLCEIRVVPNNSEYTEHFILYLDAERTTMCGEYRGLLYLPSAYCVYSSYRTM